MLNVPNAVNFRGYDLKSIQEGLKLRKMPSPDVVKELESDIKKLENSSNIDDVMKRCAIGKVLAEIGKLGLMSNRAELELKIGIQKIRLITASDEEKIVIEKSIKHCEDIIKEINNILETK